MGKSFKNGYLNVSTVDHINNVIFKKNLKMHSNNPKLIVIIINMLELEFRYLTFHLQITFAVMQSQVSKYLIINDWLLFIDFEKEKELCLCRASHPVPSASASSVITDCTGVTDVPSPHNLFK